jgi:GNAT superfamily N-acetyltransferase
MARQWVLKFVTWYNGVHLHSGLSYVTPEQRHSGLATAVLQQRQAVYAQARERHPLRWKRPPRAWQVAKEVWLNPPSKHDQRHAA